MTTFTIDTDNQITAYATPEEAGAAAASTPCERFNSLPEFSALAQSWPPARLVAIWNSLAGVKPVRHIKDAETAAKRIWKRIQSLAVPAAEERPSARKPKAAHRAQRGTQVDPGSKRPANRKMPILKKSAPPRKKGPPQAASEPRPGSKTAQVVAMLQRKNGATLSEFMQSMGWQKHTVRGFMAGAMKKAGYTVESFKSDKGERTYRLK